MAVKISVDLNSEQADEAITYLKFIGGNTDTAIRVAINKSLPRVRTKSSAAIRTQVRLKASYITGGDRPKLAIIKATKVKPEGRLRAESRGVLMTRYSTDPNANPDKFGWILPPPVPPRGIKVKIKPAGSSVPVKGEPGEIKGQPFYMILPNSRALGIVARRASPGPRGGGIKVFSSPSVSQVFNKTRDQVLPEASDIFSEEMVRAVNFLLRKEYPQE